MALEPAAHCVDALLDHIATALANLPAMAAQAERVASVLVGGASLFVGGGDHGFALEALNRAGGLAMVQWAKEAEKVQRGDVVWIGLRPDIVAGDCGLARSLRERGVTTVGFGSRNLVTDSDVFDILIDNGLPADDHLVKGQNLSVCPMSTLLNVVNLWAFTGELVAAFTRAGRMPTMLQSVAVPGARERNAELRSVKFHSGLTVPPVPSEQLGRAYLHELRRLLVRFKGSQEDAVKRCARMLADRLGSGRAPYLHMRGHLPPSEVGIPGDPNYFRWLPKPDTDAAQQIGAEDLILCLGYVGIPDEVAPIAAARHPRVIWFIATDADTASQIPEGGLLIDQQWQRGDAAVEVPGYDTRILPPSGVIQLVGYWMVVGEIAVLLHERS